jgi:D-threonine aldolase
MDPKEKQTGWYAINNIDTVDSPTLVIYLDRVKANIELIKGMVEDISRLRPHVKTHKTREASQLLMEAGVTKFKCATIAEAEMLACMQAPDVLLAYQPVGPKVKRLIQLIKTYPATSFSCLVDNVKAAESIANEALENGVSIPVYIDLNVGMNRTGISPDQKAFQLYVFCYQLPGIVAVGLHAYDGHIKDTELDIRKQHCDAAYGTIERLKEALIKSGFEEPAIIVGGSPTFPIHAKRDKVECSPGTFIFWDASYQQMLPEQHFLPAALVVSRVISHPEESIWCMDLGHKSIAAENPLGNRVSFLNAPSLQFIGQSEEHLTIQTDDPVAFKLGDVLYGLPFHICPTCALYDRALIVVHGNVATEWKIVARDRKIYI